MRHRRLEVLQSRREALGVFIGGAIVSACSSTTTPDPSSSSNNEDGGLVGGGPSCDSVSGDDVGAVDNFSVGTWSAVGSQNSPYIVSQDSNGFFAYSAICTHKGCNIGNPNPTTGKTTCPCHSSEFDGNGAVLVGPATSPLPHFAVTLCGGEVYVDSSTTVDASARTPAS